MWTDGRTDGRTFFPSILLGRSHVTQKLGQISERSRPKNLQAGHSHSTTSWFYNHYSGAVTSWRAIIPRPTGHRPWPVVTDLGLWLCNQTYDTPQSASPNWRPQNKDSVTQTAESLGKKRGRTKGKWISPVSSNLIYRKYYLKAQDKH